MTAFSTQYMCVVVMSILLADELMLCKKKKIIIIKWNNFKQQGFNRSKETCTEKDVTGPSSRDSDSRRRWEDAVFFLS